MPGPKERYEVEWCPEMPVDEHGDFEPDLAKYSRKHFNTFPEAIEFAKTILKEGKDCFGSPGIDFQVYHRDEDVFEHEGWTRMVWETESTLRVDVEDYQYTEKDLERPY